MHERSPTGAKDWNDAPQAQQERQHGAGQGRAPEPDRRLGTRLVGKEGRDTRADERR